MRERSLTRCTSRFRYGRLLGICGIGLALGTESLALADEPFAAAAPPEVSAPAPLALAELQHRLEGMEGKLRESALARKSADQARMDAERRLAESLQALDAQRTTQAELEQRLRDCEAERNRLAETPPTSDTAHKPLYRVRPGDSLATISRRVYGRSDRWPAIFAANRHQLEAPERLVPGMMLVIP